MLEIMLSPQWSVGADGSPMKEHQEDTKGSINRNSIGPIELLHVLNSDLGFHSMEAQPSVMASLDCPVTETLVPDMYEHIEHLTVAESAIPDRLRECKDA
ncbi:hypothetical protein NE237_033275 [Protea cynaroides]|uniref:Uncharacterized protein n=1 Tax=Protea cynaroides TaxID=273540 RepID=A0A9Q0R3V9_9MAGN|nr:hypothetical protein NE237_033275 [Protea cynaroides]